MHAEKGKPLGQRTRWLVDRYWGGSVNRAAKDLGVTQSLLHRVASGELDSPRTSVVDAFRRYFDVSSDWLLGGDGPEPGALDAAGRPLVPGVARWRRVVEQMELDPTMAREVLELPYSVWRAAELLSVESDSTPAWVSKALSDSLDAWSTVFEALISEPMRAPIQSRLQQLRALTRLGFSREAVGRYKTPSQQAALMSELESLFSPSAASGA